MPHTAESVYCTCKTSTTITRAHRSTRTPVQTPVLRTVPSANPPTGSNTKAAKKRMPLQIYRSLAPTRVAVADGDASGPTGHAFQLVCTETYSADGVPDPRPRLFSCELTQDAANSGCLLTMAFEMVSTLRQTCSICSEGCATHGCSHPNVHPPPQTCSRAPTTCYRHWHTMMQTAHKGGMAAYRAKGTLDWAPLLLHP